MVSGIAALASGCVRDPMVFNAISVFKQLTSRAPDQEIDRATIAKVPYALVTAKIGKGPRAVLILSRREGQDLHWTSADKITLVTRQGRIVKTAGLRYDLAATQLSPSDPLSASPHTLTEPVRFRRTVDLRAANGYLTVPIDSTTETIGPERIEIVELEFDTILIKETCRARSVNWRFENLYWVDVYDGFVWKSIQHVARDVPPIEMQTLKPASL